MGTTFRPYQPDQMLLLPQDLREWVLEGHLAHHVSDLVDALDLSPFYAPYEGDGRRNSPYDRGQAEWSWSDQSNPACGSSNESMFELH